ncbi:uncharacterized protein si:ch211-51h9.7 [Astyanax mexicanus]|uniref:uncharacterized protein si:ch211-51h9.7 n=1 Tax=Astyanax mexicanus TaxID=7994 RepID=UPI000BBD833C|nr:uncharacterized protein si:ch211-51h9.7 [Astyanax mexicanus]
MVRVRRRRAAALSVINSPPALWILSVAAVLLQEAGVCGACAAAEGLLLCRSCGHEVALERDVSFVPSRLALSHRNNTVLGERRITVQLFENPQGFQYEVLTLKKADVLKHWPADKHFTWFPGFSWTVATCPRCKTHLGWAFQPTDWPQTVTRQDFEDSDQTFVALIVQRLLQEQFASTLLMTPNSFRS